jgi:cytochrome P450
VTAADLPVGHADVHHVHDYDQVVEVLTDRGRSLSLGVSKQDQLGAGNLTLAGLWTADEPRHRDLLRLVAPAFDRDAVARWEPHIRAIVVDHLNAIAATGSGRFEAVNALAWPVPGAVICDVLGIDRDAAVRMRHWREQAYLAGGDPTSLPPQPDMADYFQQLIEDHRRMRAPRPGLLDKLLNDQRDGEMVDGHRLRDEDIAGQVAMGVWAGAATTSGAITDAALFLTSYGERGDPEPYWARLAADPGLVPGAVKEVLRCTQAFPVASRQVAVDTAEVAGRQLRRGARVALHLAAANRDPKRFHRPDTFDPERTPNRHLAFGRRPRFCTGAALAERELCIVVEEAARRLPRLRRDPDRPLQPRWEFMERTLPQLWLLY